ncbi:MAG: hypothetical protein PWP64_933 [Candidatus Cloacimonadota bacterium]|nr:hypothetical protein [Candidatus Cloacimonadota bacterium]
MDDSLYPPQPKILMLNSVRGFIGGVERLMVDLAKDLQKEGWQVFGLFEQSYSEDESFDSAFESIKVGSINEIDTLIPYYKDLGINLVWIHKCNYSNWVKQLQAHFKTVVLVHDHDYYCLRHHKYFPLQRINCHLPFNPFYCSICSAMLEKRDGSLKCLDLLSRIQLLENIKKCDLSFVLSGFMQRNLIQNGWDEDKIKLLIPFQKTHQLSSPDRPDQTVLMYAGQLIKGKGVDLLLQALSLIKRDFVCRIVGTGNDEEYLHKLCIKLGLMQKVEFAGWVSDLEAEYQNSDIVVVPSRWQEPFALVGLEAFSHAKAVVAFDVGGITQWLKHRQNGILVPEGDVIGLAASLQLLIDKPSLRKELGLAGLRTLQESYHYQAHHDSVIKPLARLLAKNRSAELNDPSLQTHPIPENALAYLTIFGIRILNINLAQALLLLESKLRSAKATPVFFVNADCLNKVFIDKEYYQIMRDTEIIFPDGFGIDLAGRMLGKPITENLNGTDMLPYLCEIAIKNNSKMFLLGAIPGVAVKMKEKLQQRYPKLNICGTQHGYFNWEKDAVDVIKKINTAQTDILLVALGVPLQEKFITYHISELEAPLQIGVGGLFDFYSERIARAPLWMRRCNMEWVFRLIQEPRRMWKRYIIGNPLFLYRVYRFGKQALAK